MVRYQASKQASKKTDFTVYLIWWGSLRLTPIIISNGIGLGNGLGNGIGNGIGLSKAQVSNGNGIISNSIGLSNGIGLSILP